MARRLGGELGQLAALFLGLGLTSFGGPLAHIAMMEERVVRRRAWMSREEFLELVGIVNLLPGPNSTELAIHIGYRRAGLRGLLVAGLAFLLPAVLIVLGLAWVYQRYGTLPEVRGLWRGVQPVVIAVVATALVGFARSAIRSAWLAGVAAVTVALSAFGVHELLVLAVGGALGVLPRTAAHAPLGLALPLLPTVAALDRDGAGVGSLFLFFLRVGSVLYGSGYVLLAFLRQELVERGGRLTEAQLLDAIAVGQATPGPVFTTATFVGYLLEGTPGALAATVGIFLPAFVLVAASGPLVRWVRGSPPARGFLAGVTVASLALMAVVTWQLGRGALTGPLPWFLMIAGLLLLRAGVNSAWLMLIGAASGLLLS